VTELAQLLVAVYKSKQTAPQTLPLQVLCQIFTSYDKMFTIFDPNVFLLHFPVKQSEGLFLNINQLDALNFIIRLFQASTCFEHMCSTHVEA